MKRRLTALLAALLLITVPAAPTAHAYSSVAPVEQLDVPSPSMGRTIHVAGLVTCRQRPGTASGVTFVTLEDETGNTNVVVWRDVAERFRVALLSSRLLVVTGRLEHQGPITHLIAARLEDASELLGELVVAGREFH